MTSADETSALKRNSVHQTRLSLELQQLEKDRAIRLREMSKASQVFARRQEQIQGVRDKAALRRVPSAHVENLPCIALPASNSTEDLTRQPFITKTARLQSAPGASNSRRPLQKTMTMPSFDLLPSRASSSHLPFVHNSAHRATSPKRTGSLSPMEDRPNSSTRVPIYSRNFSGLPHRNDLAARPARKSSLPAGLSLCPKKTRSKSVSS